jgi:hypothetical protein
MADPPGPRSPLPVSYKVTDQRYSPSDPAATENFLNGIGQQGNRLSTVYPDSQRGKTRWVFTTDAAAGPVPYKVIDQQWSPSDPAPAETLLNQLGQTGWQLVTAYPDPRRERTRWIFSQGAGQSTTPAAGTDGQVQYNAAGAFAGAANFTIMNGNPNVTAGNRYLYDGVDVIHGDTVNGSYYFGNAGATASGSENAGLGHNALQNASGGANVAIGTDAGSAITSGYQNVFIGYEGGAGVSSGYTNVLIGAFAGGTVNAMYNCIGIGAAAMRNVTGGNDNVAIGVGVLSSNTTGSNNVGIGTNVLPNSTTASNNVAIGGGLSSVTTGGSNVAIGVNSLSSNSSGQLNMAIGQDSLASNTTNSGNIAIGYYSLHGLDSSNNVAIGYMAGYTITSGRANTLIGGYVGTSAMSNAVVLSDGDGVVAVQYDVPSKTWQTLTTTVGALPAAGVAGRRAFVTDANASTFYTVAAGGGSIKVPVFDDGASWRIG